MEGLLEGTLLRGEGVDTVGELLLHALEVAAKGVHRVRNLTHIGGELARPTLLRERSPNAHTHARVERARGRWKQVLRERGRDSGDRPRGV